MCVFYGVFSLTRMMMPAEWYALAESILIVPVIFRLRWFQLKGGTTVMSQFVRVMFRHLCFD